jgi:hypothetical protein
VGGLGGRLIQASDFVLDGPGFGVGLSLAGEEGFFPFSVPCDRVGVICWVHPVIVELYDRSMCLGEVSSLVFYSVE